jgi:hypothetical protein
MLLALAYTYFTVPRQGGLLVALPQGSFSALRMHVGFVRQKNTDRRKNCSVELCKKATPQVVKSQPVEIKRAFRCMRGTQDAGNVR